MAKIAVRELTHDTALDYLFQEPMEEQFQSLVTLQSQTPETKSFLARIGDWFRKDVEETHYHYYWED